MCLCLTELPRMGCALDRCGCMGTTDLLHACMRVNVLPAHDLTLMYATLGTFTSPVLVLDVGPYFTLEHYL